MFESTLIIAQRQFEKAKELYQTAKEEVAGDVDFRHQFVDITNVSVKYPAGGPYPQFLSSYSRISFQVDRFTQGLLIYPSCLLLMVVGTKTDQFLGVGQSSAPTN
ncbi:unnamed protein product [Dibothriocephalus latus]|uniref:Neutral ceramidase n=1 Tax=Dibothriocephalus latus TaxID=60516 RepID=A0A3P7NRS9_DIBLA|nr:unnamed protein product [Dibothriocephalus latus]